jgi:uncharacterized coiled-coil protein SlyX
MAGAPDPGIAVALEAQSKSLEAQSRTLATQSKLLQQLCDRLESQDHRWSNLEKVVSANVDNITVLQDKLEDGEIEAFRRDVGDQVVLQVAAMEVAAQERIGAIAANATMRMAALENVNSVYESWRSRIEGYIESLQTSVDSVRSDLHRLTDALEHGGHDAPHNQEERPPAPWSFPNGPIGHGATHRPREYGGGAPFSPNHLPNNGMNPPPTPHREQYSAYQFWEHYPSRSEVHGGGFQDMIHPRTLGNLPKIQFPSFDGENPRLWQKRCEDYFHMYSVGPSLWIQVAYMQFTGPASRWVQSVESQLVSLTWDQFAHMVRERFGKNHHQMLLRQLFHIRQTASVASYVEEFH